MKITIDRADNGAQVKIDYQDPDAAHRTTVYAFDEYEPDGLADMLWNISDAFISGHKRMEKRVIVEIRHGSDWDCKKKECEICQK